MVVDGKTRGERWNGRDKHAGREGRRRRGNLQKQRLPRGLQLRMHLSERGPWRFRGWLRFLPVCRNHLCVCVRIIHPPALFIFSFSFSSLAKPPYAPPIHRSFRRSITRGREHPSWIGCTRRVDAVSEIRRVCWV